MPPEAGRKFKVLVADKLAEQGVELLRKDGRFEVEVKLKLPPEELAKAVADIDGLIVRSETKVKADIIAAAPKLKVIARAGVGIDNVDVPTATKHGVLVMNAPDSITMAAAEHTMALLMSMVRNVAGGNSSLKAGEWARAKYMGTELNGKTMGVIGMGRIGGEVAKRCLAFGMRVMVYDPIVTPEKVRELGAEPAALADLYREADIISVHVPLRPETKGLLGKDAFAAMKKGVRIVNCARGGVVDEAALAEAITGGKVAQAALDVFEKEPPPPDNPLFKLEAVTVTPHLGASTEEAQVNVAVVIAEQVRDYLVAGAVRNAVNVPSTNPELLKELAPWRDLAYRMGRMLVQMVDGAPKRISIEYRGEISGKSTGLVTATAVTGVLSHATSGRVNEVNAVALAKEKGIEVAESKSGTAVEFASSVCLTVESGNGKRMVEGTVMGKGEPHVVAVDGLHLDIVPRGVMIAFTNVDKPGIVGKVGTILGRGGVNIAGLNLGRMEGAKRAVSIFSVDNPVSAEVLKELSGLEELADVRVVVI